MRKMASVQRILDIKPIDGADKIEIVVINSWNVVVNKGLCKHNDLVVYCEIDSWIPNSIAPFLTPEGKEPKEYLGVKGEKLRTKRMRGVLSQGLVLPFNILSVEYDVNVGIGDWQEGDDVSDQLGIMKYDPPLPAQLAGQAKGNFPSLIPKTNEDRVQNLTKEFDKFKQSGLTWEVTEKLEGSSCTFYLDLEGNFDVCSRNLSLKEDANNSFWKAAKMYDVESKMRQLGAVGYAIQGELVGEGIQGNIYNIKGVDFYCFTIYSTTLGRYLTPKERIACCEATDLKHAPVLHEDFNLNDYNIEEILAFADGKSQLNPKQNREGLVFKCNENTEWHWKAISNNYLLKEKE